MSFDLEIIKPYIIPAAIAAFFIYRRLKYRTVKKRLPGLLREGALVVDVRTREEFAAGSCPGSINIPLDELQNKAGRLDREKPVILCCASGARSGMAVRLFKNLGFRTVVNAGPWQNTVQQAA